MSYFKYMPNVLYEGDTGGQVLRAVDITVRARILEFVKNSQSSVVDYTLKDGERPEHISQKVYDRPDYHWIVLLYNEMHDPYFEWPMSSRDLDEMVQNKYGGRAYFVDLKVDQGDQASYEVINPKKPQDFWFEGGLTATINGTSTGKILEWNPNLCKLVVDSQSPGVATFPNLGEDSAELGKVIIRQNRTDGTEVRAYVKRIVDDNRYAVHHFIKSETGEIVDHHIVPDNQAMRRDWGSANVGCVGDGCSLSYLDRYIKERKNIIELDSGTVAVVKNYDYELDLNEAKRNIKVLRPQFAELVAKDIKKVFLGG